MSEKCLIILIGETFRTGFQDSRERDRNESYLPQIKSSENHVNFIKYIENKFNLKCDIVINTYYTKYKDVLLNIYKELNILEYNVNNNYIGLENLLRNGILLAKNKTNLNDYKFITSLRLDIMLKQLYFDIFNPNWNSIMFPTLCYIIQGYDKTYEGYPRVNHNIIFIPNRFFNLIPNYIFMSHDSWYYFIKNTPFNLQHDDIDVMLNTYHDSDSYKDYQPLYTYLYRHENKNWKSKGYVFNKKLLNYVKVDNEHIFDYDNVTH
jgi:hypothetical protein